MGTTINQKVKNATKVEYNGILFRSKLEVSIYKALLNEGISPDYEPNTIKVWDHPNLYVPFFDKWGKKFQRIYRKPLAIKYTPDFVFDYEGYKVYLEVKGFKNDVSPYKIKLFRQWLEKYSNNSKIKCCYAIIYSIKNLKEFLLYMRENIKKLNTFANENII